MARVLMFGWAFFLLALLIVQFVTLPVYRAGIAWGMSRATMEAFADWGALLIALLPYLYLALRRAYGDSRLSGATRTVAVLLAGAVVLQVYRLVLFFTTYAAI